MTIYEQTQKIRSIVSDNTMYQILIKDGVIWDQLCSCLDVIDDTELVIDAYTKKKFGTSTEELYLITYGLLQILYVQQYAVKFLCKSLVIPENIYSNAILTKIRDIRNDTIGHATERGKKSKLSYHHISRAELYYDRFKYISFFSNGNAEFKDVKFPDLIITQRTCLTEILTFVINKLEQREKEYKDEFKMEKLTSFLPDITNYDFEKIMFPDKIPTHPDKKTSTIRGALGLKHIKQVIQEFKTAIDKRRVKYESIDSVFKEIEYPLSELEQYYKNVEKGEATNINEKTVYIFACFLQGQIKELKEMAQEIDDKYSS